MGRGRKPGQAGYRQRMEELQRYQGPATFDKVSALARRRGFAYPGSDIYGGLGSSYDYGHYGVLLKQNVKALWQKAMLERGDVVALDAAVIMHPEVWVASGHVQGFSDPLVDCRTCKQRFRADQLEQSCCGQKPSKQPGQTPECDLTEARQFNLMFETSIGPVQDAAAKAYLRPETAQGIFVNFENVTKSLRVKPPFGIAQIGKSFRNEITPQNFLFRTREFEQMEMEFFVRPGEDEEWYRYWVQERYDWYVRNGLRPSHLRLREHESQELAHYAKATTDVEYLFPIGWSELEGIANRTDYDLKAHSKASGKRLMWGSTEEGYVPYVIEPAAGADRAALAFLVDAYDEEEIEGRQRVVLRLHPKVAPVKAAVIPLARNNEELVAAARGLYDRLKDHLSSEFDDVGNVGKAYRRQDEIGTPWCLTVDHQTLEDQAVTIRDRDTLEQVRVPVERAREWLLDRLSEPWSPRP